MTIKFFLIFIFYYDYKYEEHGVRHTNHNMKLPQVKI